MNRIRVIALPVGIAALALTPIVLAAPAEASTTAGGCTLTPGRPVASGLFTPAGDPLISYPITAVCPIGVTVEANQRRMDQDTWAREMNRPDDLMGQTTVFFDFTAAGGTKVATVLAVTVPTGPALELNDEEAYNDLSFRVTSGAVVTPWTAREMSAITVVPD
ncbi:hypothetical protein ACPPVT_01050 [Angustibacter sp. McL0619]|uniref:hypothetical protein n=1 Tax=Angustibacter sp. McL0619 TaxID=3415676 RepID=UPI003CF67E59